MDPPVVLKQGMLPARILRFSVSKKKTKGGAPKRSIAEVGSSTPFTGSINLP
jgi:hypothetical protein